MNSWWANYGYFINSAGGGFFNEDRTECALDTPESIAGLTQMKAIYDKWPGRAVRRGRRGAVEGRHRRHVHERPLGHARRPRRRRLQLGRRASCPTGPGGTQGNWLFWGAYVVNAKTEHPEEALDLVKALTTVDTQATISELGANIPSRQSDDAIEAFLGFTPPENNQAFINGLQDSPTAEGPLWAGDWPKFDEVTGAAVTAVVTGERTVEDFAANICSETAVAFEG